MFFQKAYPRDYHQLGVLSTKLIAYQELHSLTDLLAEPTLRSPKNYNDKLKS